jgi:hypothetical protein
MIDYDARERRTAYDRRTMRSHRIATLRLPDEADIYSRIQALAQKGAHVGYNRASRRRRPRL